MSLQEWIKNKLKESKINYFYKHFETNTHKNIIFILINSYIISDTENIEYVFTNGNAASGNTNFCYSLNNLNNISYDILHSHSSNLNLMDKEVIRKRCSEFLIYPKVETKYFWKLCVENKVIKGEVEKMLEKNNLKKTVEIDESLFTF